jgi:hypothetical protein
LSQWLTVKIPPGLAGSRLLLFNIWQDDHKVAVWPIKTIQVQDWEHNYSLPPVDGKVEAVFGDEIELIGYTVDMTATQDQQIRLTLYWRGLKPVEEDYVTFTHLLDADSQIVSQIDHIPGGGSRPTPGWLVGEIVADVFELDIPPSVDLTRSSLEIGLYSGEDFQRLPVKVGDQLDNRVIIKLTGQF